MTDTMLGVIPVAHTCCGPERTELFIYSHIIDGAVWHPQPLFSSSLSDYDDTGLFL